MDFDTAFSLVIDTEQGFQKDPRDSGNWTGGKVNVGELKGTKYGISAAAYPDLDIINLTLNQAKQIYKKDYWDVIRADELPDPIKFCVFDTAVNSGVTTAIKTLQQAVGVKADGAIGKITMEAIKSMDPYQIKCRFLGIRLNFITNIRNWDVYGKGWTVRIAKILTMD